MSQPAAVSNEMRALHLNHAVATLDTEGCVRRVNNRYLSLFGRSIDEVVGASEYGSVIACRDHAAYDRLWRRLAAGEIQQMTHLGRSGDGRKVWVESVYTPFFSDQALSEVVVFHYDITDQQERSITYQGQIDAINLSNAVAHFDTGGHILDVNTLFCEITGYDREELIGRHHRLLVPSAEADSPAYQAFWDDLAKGRYRSEEFRRVDKAGRDIWLQATYNPIFEPTGEIAKIVKYAADVTAEKLRMSEYQWQVAAINKSHAVVVFDMHGTIIDANAIFLDAFGYTADEVLGEHHRVFVESAHAHSIEYQQFWSRLQQGHHNAGEYKRVARDGRAVWLQATYNPIFDMSGRPIKVIKYASIVTEEKLQRADHQSQIAAIHKSQAVICFDLDGFILDANENYLRLMGYRFAEVRGRHHRMFMDDEEADSEAYARFWEALRQGEYRSAEFKRYGKGTREVWLRATYNPIFDMEGRPFKVVKYAADITEEKRRDADYRSQIEAINKSQGVVELGLDGTILSANDNFLQTVGYPAGELEGRHHRVLIEPSTAESAEYQSLWDTLRSGAFHTGLYRRLTKNNEEVWLQATYNPVLDLNGRPYKVVKFAIDVSANVAMANAYDEAARMAQHDAATSLPNRLKLASFLTSALPHASARVAVLYIDLDCFKPVNDTLGHDIGDRVLGEIADRLRRDIDPDQLVARLGGDEFVIAAPALADEAVEALCRRIISHIEQPIHHRDGDIRLSASIGVALSPIDGTSPDDLLRHADLALGLAKKAGRATYRFFTEEMNQRVQSYRALTDDMRRALANDEFVLEYQPRFQTDGRVLRSVEALVRWAHPERGLVSPAAFIPLAEQNGLIVAIGKRVLQTACQTIAQHSETLGVSVNISPVQFKDSALIDTIEQALKTTGLAASRLELEVTEGMLLENGEHAQHMLERIKALGVRLAIDDFGTGYSSLSYLRSFPFDVIKLDRQFIRDMDAENSTRAIVKAVLGLGSALGLSVTAEGVETRAQLDMLTTNRCAEVQGFLLARPMPIADLQGLLSSQTDGSLKRVDTTPADGDAGAVAPETEVARLVIDDPADDEDETRQESVRTRRAAAR